MKQFSVLSCAFFLLAACTAEPFSDPNRLEEDLADEGEPGVVVEVLDPPNAKELVFTQSASVVNATSCPEHNIASDGASLVFSDPAALQEPFRFSRTLGQIAQTGGARSSIELVRSMLSSFVSSSATNSDLTIPLDIREREASLDANELVEQMQPVGVFNRLDLAPSDGSHCGEQRIVYAMVEAPGDSSSSLRLVIPTRIRRKEELAVNHWQDS